MDKYRKSRQAARLRPGSARCPQGSYAGVEAIVEELGESEALRLIEQAAVGRIGFTGRYGPVVVPVTYKLIDQDIVFRVEMYSTVGEDLRTGIPGAEYRVAFEVDEGCATRS